MGHGFRLGIFQPVPPQLEKLSRSRSPIGELRLACGPDGVSARSFVIVGVEGWCAQSEKNEIRIPGIRDALLRICRDQDDIPG